MEGVRLFMANIYMVIACPPRPMYDVSGQNAQPAMVTHHAWLGPVAGHCVYRFSSRFWVPRLSQLMSDDLDAIDS